MASNVIIAKRYAKALMSVCQGVEGAKSAASALGDISRTILGSKEFLELLKSPAFSAADKWKVIQEVAVQLKAPEHLVRFLRVLTLNKRAQVIPELEVVFKEQVLELDASVEAEVETAIELSDAQVAQLAGVLSKYIGKKVKLSQKLIPELIAGIRVNVSGETMDASFASSLKLVHRELLVAQA